MSETTAFEKYHCYMKGWKTGAGSREIDPIFYNKLNDELKKIYNNGWEFGVASRINVGNRMADKFNYKPSILKIHGSDG